MMVHLSAGWILAVGLLTRAIYGEVVEVTPANFDTIVDGSSNVLLEFYAPWCGHCKKLAPEYEILGSQYTKKDGVVIAKVDAQEHQALAGLFGVSGYPTLKWMAKGKKLPSEAEDVKAPRTADGLSDYVADKAAIKSKKPPAPPSSVMDLTSETFNAIALDPRKHALVEFFAPWCGHCKKLIPVYEKLGSAFAAESNVVIAKVDATEEKDLATRYGVSGFPTLKYFPAGDGEVETYGGARSLEAFVDFINEKADTARTPDGGLTPMAGRLPVLDEIISDLPSAPATELASHLEEVVESLGFIHEAHKASAGHYIRAAKKIVERGPGYLESELKRLEGLLSEPKSLSPQKRTLFIVRRNILKAFVEAGIGQSGGAATEADAGSATEL